MPSQAQNIRIELLRLIQRQTSSARPTTYDWKCYTVVWQIHEPKHIEGSLNKTIELRIQVKQSCCKE